MKSLPQPISFACLILLGVSSLAMGQQTFDTDPIVDWPMRVDPDLQPVMPQQVLSQSTQQVWLKAFEQPQLAVRLQVMQSIAQASRDGIPDLDNVFGDKLKQVLANRNSENAAALSAANALITLGGDQSAASLLLERNQTQNTDWILLTDPALAKWNWLTAVDTWIKRATDPTSGFSARNSALEQLAVLHPEKAHGPLRQLLGQTDLNPLLKLAAARALGQIASRGLLSDARRLAKGDLISRLAAVACLQSHDTDAVKTFLQGMLDDQNNAVRLATGRLLLKIAPEKLMTRFDAFASSDDSMLRSLAARCMVKQITPQRVPSLVAMINDIHPQIRVDVRNDLIQLAQKPSLKDAIIAASMKVIKQDAWRGREQASYILGKLDAEDAVDNLFDVLEHTDRREARIAAATAIRWLNINSIQPRALSLSEQLFNGMKRDLNSKHGMELAQLLQWLGQTQYTQATSLFIELIPKNIAPSVAREAAVWSIGKIGKAPQTGKLANKLMARVKDANEMNPESPDVQLASMVAIARLGNPSMVSHFIDSRGEQMMMLDTDMAQLCKIWVTSLSEGKPYVKPVPETQASTGWPLEPISQKTED